MPKKITTTKSTETVKLVISKKKLQFVTVYFENSDKNARLWVKDYQNLKRALGLPFISGKEVTVDYCQCDTAMCPLRLTVSGITVSSIPCCTYDDEGENKHK